MEKITIDKYRIVPAPTTGIGWVAVQSWDNVVGAYKHISTHRSESESKDFINILQKND